MRDRRIAAVETPDAVPYGARMDPVVYKSKVRIERLRGTFRRAHLPGSEEPVYYGVHGAVADHYGVARGSEEERTTTLDHIVAAAAG